MNTTLKRISLLSLLAMALPAQAHKLWLLPSHVGHGDPVAAGFVQVHIEDAAAVTFKQIFHGSGLTIWAGDLQIIQRVGALHGEDVIGDAGIHGDPLGLGDTGMAGQQPQLVGLGGQCHCQQG